jgi:hypothetical protein
LGHEVFHAHTEKEILIMPKRSHRSAKTTHAHTSSPSAPVARTTGTTLRSHAVGALPILNDILQRMRLEEFFRDYLPPEERRTKLPNAKGLLVLLRNLLVSREPIYGIGEWAVRHAPDLLGLQPSQIEYLNDDRIGRALDRLFLADTSSLALHLAGPILGNEAVFVVP